MKTKSKTKAAVRNAAPTAPAAARRLIRRVREEQSLTSSALEQTNPLRGLTLAKAVALLECTLRGDYAQAQWTFWHIEQSDPDLIALESRRSAALMEMDWNIKLADLSPRIAGRKAEAASADTILANEQADALAEAYNGIDNLNAAIEDMALAFARGFSIAQCEPAEAPASLHLGIYDPWNIVRAGLKGDFYFNPDARSVSWRVLAEDSRLDPANHLIYTPRTALLRIAMYKFIRQNLSQKDWDAFIEIYGLPSAYIIQPPNVPEEKQAEYRDAALAAAEGAGGSLPYQSDVKFATEPRGNNPFRDHLKYLQEQLILAGTGGLLTMLAMPTGIGSGASGEHDETFKTIARAEAKKISEVFQKQFDQRILARHFPGRPALAYFELAFQESQDVGEIIEHAVKLRAAGYMADLAELSEKTGYKLQPAPAGDYSQDGVGRLPGSPPRLAYNRATSPAPARHQGPASQRAPAPSILRNARADAAGAQTLRRLQQVLDEMPPSPVTAKRAAELADALEAAARALPGAAPAVAAELAEWLERGMAEAAVKGVNDALR